MITISSSVCLRMHFIFFRFFEGRLRIQANHEIDESVNLFRPDEKFHRWGLRFKRRVVRFFGEIPEELKPFSKRDDDGSCSIPITFNASPCTSEIQMEF